MKEKGCSVIDHKTVLSTYEDRRVTINVTSIFTGKKKLTELIAPSVIVNIKNQNAE